jgi:hypothetical protein
MCLLASPRLYPLFSCLVKAYTQRLTICYIAFHMSDMTKLTNHNITRYPYLMKIVLVINIESKC